MTPPIPHMEQTGGPTPEMEWLRCQTASPQEIIDGLIRDIKGTQSLDAIQSANCEAWIRRNFAQAVAAEREACAKLSEELEATYEIRDYEDSEAKAKGGYSCETRNFAAAIRARELAPVMRPDDVDYPADHFGDLR